MVSDKTGDWLHQKSDTEKVEIMQEARKKVNAPMERLNTKGNILEERKLSILKSKQEIKKSQEDKSAMKQTETVNRIFSLNVRAWIEEEEVDDNISFINGNKSNLRVLYAQLDYYKNVVLKNRKCQRDFLQSLKMVFCYLSML